MDQRVITLFHESIEAKMQAGEELAPLIAHASQAIVNALLNDKKILTCGNGISAAQAQIFTACLLDRFEHERPSLPALSLGTDLTTQTAISADYSFNDVYARQIRAIGQPGDLLVLLSSDGNNSNLLQAISAAHEKDIQIIALTGRDGGDAALLLDSRDIELRAALNSRPRIHEVHLLTLFCLCDLIEQQLFGGFES
ncbi:SIS domain-containing protein [Cellvibrio polysaccharolyticus]|uniref:SIS domain-containing protein n=1 Tax=Cellvibrio polysaccharolyticus TaxID=2082724 RepID=A0A928V474_9GAMM|nr:SIS domain-containing protein [Cellvibrio polysaccharolyticus]MBE8718420.1 SIS domain-containing protein [Cellvibrio polysaccharolyticus]